MPLFPLYFLFWQAVIFSEKNILFMLTYNGFAIAIF